MVISARLQFPLRRGDEMVWAGLLCGRSPAARDGPPGLGLAAAQAGAQRGLDEALLGRAVQQARQRRLLLA
jgi:hypothetical protein